MFKKLILSCLTVVLSVTLVACGEAELTDQEIVLQVRDAIVFDSYEITEDLDLSKFDDERVTIAWTSSNEDYLTADGKVTRPAYYSRDKQVDLIVTITLGDLTINKKFEFTVVNEDEPAVIELNTDETDALAMDFAYEGLSFIDDRVGEVTLVSCVDGDTAVFTEGGENFTVRFLGIDTPESTAKVQEWGKAASKFTCDKLTNAETIVLQAEPTGDRMDSYGTRYLAWVWYDGRLLNLELVEQAYSKAKGLLELRYGELVFEVSNKVSFTNRRIWGEEDPDFDYSIEGVQVTIQEILTNPTDYENTKVAVTGVVTSKVGNAAYIQQGDFGIYLYYRSWAPDLTVGNEVQITGLVVGYYPDAETGAIQLSNYKNDAEHSTVLSTGNVIEPTVINVSDITELYVGRYVKVEDLTVVSVYENEDSFTVTARDAQGNEITVRKDSAVSDDIEASMFEVGTTFTVIAPISKYSGNYQLMLTDIDDIIITE